MTAHATFYVALLIAAVAGLAWWQLRSRRRARDADLPITDERGWWI
jgi:hypothetical protein